MNPRIAIIHAQLRPEERLLVAAFQRRGITCDLIDDRTLVLDPNASGWRYDAVVARGVAQQRTFHVVTLLEAYGVPVVNPSHILERCNDKLRTSAALAAAGTPQPRVRIAFTPASALEAAEDVGYPVVIKPTVGSWGRLLARVNDRRAAAALLAQKQALGGFQHGTYYIQEYVPTGGRDIRAFVRDGETLCAIYRSAAHWITNTARGGRASNCPVGLDLAELCGQASNAVGGGLLAIDVLEHPERGLLVNEVNATMEFRNSISTTGVDIPNRIVDHVLNVARRGFASPTSGMALARRTVTDTRHGKSRRPRPGDDDAVARAC